MFVTLVHITQLVDRRTDKWLSPYVVVCNTCAKWRYAVKKRMKLTHAYHHMITAQSMIQAFMPSSSWYLSTTEREKERVREYLWCHASQPLITIDASSHKCCSVQTPLPQLATTVNMYLTQCTSQFTCI